LRLTRPLGDPLLGLLPILIEREQASLATTLDELIGLGDELARVDPRGQGGVGWAEGVVGGGRIPGYLGDFGGWVDEGRFELWGGRVHFRSAREPVSEEEFGVELPDSFGEEWGVRRKS
jgi:hypothetical protein